MLEPKRRQDYPAEPKEKLHVDTIIVLLRVPVPFFSSQKLPIKVLFGYLQES